MSLLMRTAHAEGQLGSEQENVVEDTEEIVYNASGWIPETFHMDIMYTATTDSEEDIVEFAWDYSSEVDDEDCIPLEDVSDSL